MRNLPRLVRQVARRLVSASFAIVAMLVLAACNNGGATPAEVTGETTAAPAPTTQPAPVSTVTSSTSLPLNLRAEIEADLVASRAAFLAAALLPEQGDADLDLWFFDSEVVELRQRLGFLADSGRATRVGDADLDSIFVEIIAENGDGRLNVTYCLSTDVEVYELNTGAVISEGQKSSRRFALMTLIDNVWKVGEDDLIESFDDIGCLRTS